MLSSVFSTWLAFSFCPSVRFSAGVASARRMYSGNSARRFAMILSRVGCSTARMSFRIGFCNSSIAFTVALCLASCSSVASGRSSALVPKNTACIR